MSRSTLALPHRMLHSAYMDQALIQAKYAAEQGEVPVGAVLVDTASNQVIACAHNRTEALQQPWAHAEWLVIQIGCERMQSKTLSLCDLYVTLEPCPMCAHILSLARIRRLYFGASDPKGGGVEHGPCIYDHPTCHHRPEIYGGFQAEASRSLLQAFFAQRR